LIPYGRQDISESDIQTVVNVLRSDFLTQGPTVPLFEKKINSYCNAKYSVAANSATSALHIACLSLGLGRGDRLWTSPNTFVASANCGLACGAEVDFVDINPDTYNMSIEALEGKLEIAEKENKLPKIIIPVHFAGQSCDMKSIHRLSIKYGFKVIEDASHAIGGRYLGEKIGGCHYSDITIFSFHPVKIITTGEGGVATTNDLELAEQMRRLRTHGITRDKELMVGEVDGDWSYQQIELGYNYRMTDLQAALGVSQMDRISKFIKCRTEIWNVYEQMLSSLPIIKPWQDSNTESSFHLYPIQINAENNNLNRKIVFNRLRESGIGVNIHYIPIHTQPFYRKLGFKKGDFPNAEKYYKNTISLPIYPTLTNAQQSKVVSELTKALDH
jgi:UDP-4-amino-4,6-dideoxy-N-acetyl-beta-L-altrosamine transaminase